jgi:SAM-dependent MidA family methyltransferase
VTRITRVAVRTWREAWGDALYGADGFYRAGRGGAGRDFRTAATAGGELAGALAALLPHAERVVDVGAGDGGLLAALAGRLPGAALTGVEKAPAPEGLPAAITWTPRLPDRLDGLVVAHELLDVVPCDVVADGRLLLVDDTGREELGPPPSAEDMAWLDAWWPSWRAGARAEIGRARDEAWADVVRRLGSGVAVAVDYGHTAATRPDGGSLCGYRAGRPVVPVPDGSCDLTAHVALDAVAAATGARLVPAPLPGWPGHHWLVSD